MTTSDLIAEALERFEKRVRAIIREEIRSSKYAITPKGGGEAERKTNLETRKP